MKKIILLLGVLFTSSFSMLQAGTIIGVADGSATDGKLTLSSSAIHVENSSSADVNFQDILEADFTDVPFQLTYFSSNDTSALPADWKSQDIGKPNSPGSMTYAAGTFTINAGGSAVDRKENDDQIFFAGRQWIGDGQLTVRIQAMDPTDPAPEAGLMLRDSLDANSAMIGLGAFGGTTSKGLFHYRSKAGDHPGWGGDFPLDMPAWLRLTRTGSGIDGAYSVNGTDWQNMGHYETKVIANPWFGIFANSRNDKAPAKITIDQVSFTPTSCTAQVFPAGVWLKSGSFIAGVFNHLDFDAAHPDANGSFNRSGKEVMIAPSQIGEVTTQPMPRTQLAAGSAQLGLMMKNGDFMNGDFQSINGEGVQLSSLALGVIKYPRTQVGACVIHAPDPQTADYEIRLRDGSIIRASSLGANNGQLVLGEVSGVAIPVDAAEVAQFRAGTSRVQTLLELPWKATSLTPPAAPAANPAPVAPAIAPVPAAPNAPAAPAPVQAPVAQCWQGPNQEQIMVAPVGTEIDFPLTGKFSAVAMKIAVAPDMPPNALAVVRVFADGREAARTPAIKAGDQPRFVEVTVQDPKTVTLVADSSFAGMRVLFIDPIAIRETQP